jgi:hypothetical protein
MLSELELRVGGGGGINGSLWSKDSTVLAVAASLQQPMPSSDQGMLERILGLELSLVDAFACGSLVEGERLR